MTCQDFELMMADALGDELSEPQRGAFEKHLAECMHCRAEYEAGQAVIRGMQAIPGPPAALVDGESYDRREAPRPRIATATTSPDAVGRSLRWIPLLRHAAVIALAFVAGYAVRGTFAPKPGGGSLQPFVQRAPDLAAPADDRSFESALTSVYRRRPAGSDLAKCMSALFRAG